jgi:hypothetical protein
VKSESLETVCARQWRICVDKARAGLQGLPDDKVLTVRYEELVNGEDTLRNLCDFAGIEDQDSVLARYRETVYAQALEKWDSDLTDGQKQDVLREIEDLLSELGYTA